MYDNKITKTFRNRRALLRGSFPSAHDFLVQLETQSAPVVWLHTASNAAVYWQDGFLLYVRFVDIGEVNTGIRLTPQAPSLVEGTEDRAFLLFPDAIDRLIRQHEGFRYRWAVRVDDGGFEFRHPAPSTFFRDLVALVERMGAQHRAARNAEAVERELMQADDDATQAAFAPAPAKQAPAPPKPRRPKSGRTKAAARRSRTPAAAPAAPPPSPATPAPKAKAPPAPRRPRVRESARPLDPRDTQRFLSFEHLVDAYFDFAAHDDDHDPLYEYYQSRLEGLESLFFCRLPRAERNGRGAATDRGQVAAFAWRCVRLANSLESPFLAPVSSSRPTMISKLWNDHGSSLGTPVEELRLACRAAFREALLKLFPGIDDTVVGEVDLLELGVAGDPPPG